MVLTHQNVIIMSLILKANWNDSSIFNIHLPGRGVKNLDGESGELLVVVKKRVGVVVRRAPNKDGRSNGA